jgi:hypothetical protein
MKSQSAVEFLTTYSWAFLILGMFVVSILAIISLPNKSSASYQPASCYISPSFPCSEALMATNSIASLFILIFQNNLGTGVYFPENALAYNGIVLAPSFTSNATYGGYCYPQNAPVGATITCNVSISGYSIPVASQVNPRFTLIYQICSPVCAKQIYNTSGTAVAVVEPYKSIIYQVQLLSSPSAGSIALNGVKYANGANVIFVAGASYNIYAVPFGTHSFSSWSVSGGAMVGSTTSQSTTANAVGSGTITATFT